MIIGPYINSSAVLIGASTGAALSARIPANVRTAMPLTFGAASMAMGVVMISQVAHMPVMVLASILGALIGELIGLEGAIGKLGASTKAVIDKVAPAPKGITQAEFLEKFVAILVLFGASGTGIFGAMNEGMTGDATILIAKSFLDLFTAAIFAITLGYSVATIAVVVLAVQLLLAYGATLIMPLTSVPMIADFKAVGGLIMLATGLRISGIKMFPVANMLPALVLAMPITALWMRVF
ncbi:DUF554 domain-containing protein [Paraburkholderia sp. Ac-20347]|jgi:uncharacterized protein|uniref:DUF554 domain-containing protein n=1 Tax=Paraburkholderia sp. Ac-20347 TaxID=2703892 RepID=UPI001981F5A5|nr:DUF554 domain-containing protein [Paraburkholderia sp. Ac-20347]MBN3809024.1 DUF554 domain-containing protein [Paraburkholderia sp. Ac-20347]